MSFLSSIGGIVSKASGVVNKIASFVKDPIGTISKPLNGLIDKLAPKLPFGLGKLVAPFAKKFLGSALSWVSKGPLAGVFTLLDKVAPTVSKLAGFVGSLDKLLNGGLKSLPKEAKENAANIVARQHARAIAA
jgi:hypothetical protein